MTDRASSGIEREASLKNVCRPPVRPAARTNASWKPCSPPVMKNSNAEKMAPRPAPSGDWPRRSGRHGDAQSAQGQVQVAPDSLGPLPRQPEQRMRVKQGSHSADT
ncbi:hypothetical protein Ddc_23776 [Ditylenchus destructor]|nr:hypothetical protein Ddc_23776 [Ditylenchus destructor]